MYQCHTTMCQGQRQAVLRCTGVVIVVHHRAAAVVPELRRRHLRTIQVPLEVFDASQGSASLLRRMDLPLTSVLRLLIALPLFLSRICASPGKLPGLIRSWLWRSRRMTAPRQIFSTACFLKKISLHTPCLISIPTRVTDR